MMEFAWYSVISPEACSAILFKGNEAQQLADSLRLTSSHLKQLGVVDAIISEPLGGRTAIRTRPLTAWSNTSPRRCAT